MDIWDTGLFARDWLSLCKNLILSPADRVFTDHKAGYGIDDNCMKGVGNRIGDCGVLLG